MSNTDYFKYKKRIIVKIGSSSLHHVQTGMLDLTKIERLVRELCDIRNTGVDVCLVSSGAIAVGRNTMSIAKKPVSLPVKQACAAVGQAKLMMIYQKLFSEYNQTAAQILLTRFAFTDEQSRINTYNTFNELFNLGAIPIVNENDTMATHEIEFGDNDNLSAMVSSLIGADLLILLSDIDGLYTDNPRVNPDAKLIPYVEDVDAVDYDEMAKDTTGSDVGSGGMTTKLAAARIATKAGADMIIANGRDVRILHTIMDGNFTGTLFKAKQPL